MQNLITNATLIDTYINHMYATKTLYFNVSKDILKRVNIEGDTTDAIICIHAPIMQFNKEHIVTSISPLFTDKNYEFSNISLKNEELEYLLSLVS